MCIEEVGGRAAGCDDMSGAEWVIVFELDMSWHKRMMCLLLLRKIGRIIRMSMTPMTTQVTLLCKRPMTTVTRERPHLEMHCGHVHF